MLLLARYKRYVYVILLYKADYVTVSRAQLGVKVGRAILTRYQLRLLDSISLRD